MAQARLSVASLTNFGFDSLGAPVDASGAQLTSRILLTVANSRLEPSIRRLYSELGEKGIRFRPHVWLSEEWFSPDGVPGIAIPFYLAHPRLIKLQNKITCEINDSQ